MKHTHFTFTLVCPSCDAVVTDHAIFDPGYPAPYATDHDSPAFSDPGDPGYVENYPEECPWCNVPISDGVAWEQGEAALDRAADHYEGPDER